MVASRTSRAPQRPPSGSPRWLPGSRQGSSRPNPDQPQLPVRVRALHAGKLVYMAVPKLADPLPFFRLDPAELGDEAEPLAAHRTAARRAPKTAVVDMRPVDLIICGTVAVDRQGMRIGKGAGYSVVGQFELSSSAISVSVHTWSATPAAIAGVVG